MVSELSDLHIGLIVGLFILFVLVVTGLLLYLLWWRKKPSNSNSSKKSHSGEILQTTPPLSEVEMSPISKSSTDLPQMEVSPAGTQSQGLLMLSEKNRKLVIARDATRKLLIVNEYPKC